MGRHQVVEMLLFSNPLSTSCSLFTQLNFLDLERRPPGASPREQTCSEAVPPGSVSFCFSFAIYTCTSARSSKYISERKEETGMFGLSPGGTNQQNTTKIT